MQKDQLKAIINLLRKAQLTLSPYKFTEIFGEDISYKYWETFSKYKRCDIIAFWGYLDEAYKEVFLSYLLSLVDESTEKQQ